jgi:ferredoxin
VRLKIDTSLCVGHGLCYMHAPQLVEPDESGYGRVRGQELDLPEEFVEMARKAERNCPEDAVMLTP